MEFKEGLIVKANKGRDKGDYFVIIKLENDYAYICNGKNRKLENLKKKNCKHLFVTNDKVSLELIDTNKKIRKLLAPYGG